MERCPQGDRGVSPVIGTILMVAIAVVLATVLGSLALGFEGELQDPSPQGGFTTEMHPAGGDNAGKPYFVLTYEAGPKIDASQIRIKDVQGNTVTWADVWTTSGSVRAGQQIHIDGDGSDGALQHVCTEGQMYYIIYQNDNGETIDTMEYEVPVAPDPSSASWC